MYVLIQYGRHLPLLDLADPSLGVEDYAVHALLAAEACDGGGTGVAGGGAEDGEAAVVVALLEEVLEEATEHLEGDVLESKGGAVEELEDIMVADLDKGGDVGFSV